MPNLEISNTFKGVILSGILLVAGAGGLALGYVNERAERVQHSVGSTYRQCISKFDYDGSGLLETNEIADLTRFLSTLPDVPKRK